MGRRIIDEFSHLPISRQRKCQLRHARDGLCEKCGKKRNPLYVHCTTCADVRRLASRAYGNYKPWVPGGPGRIPKNISAKNKLASVTQSVE